MKEINRDIAVALIHSKDNKLLMGKKDPNGGGVYLDCWLFPGGGTKKGETLKDTLIRETQEETGLDVRECNITQYDYIDKGTSEKTLKDTGEIVLCHMNFYRFKIQIDQNAKDIILKSNGELVAFRWVDIDDLANIKQVPGGVEFFKKIGYIG